MSAKFLHEVNEKQVKDGKVMVHEELIIHGDKGVTMKFYHKENDKIMKVVIVKKPEGYLLKTVMDGKADESTMSKSDLLKEVKKHKQLKFILDYLESAKDLARPVKRGSRKAGSRKSGSKKGSKRSGMRKMSRKGSKRGSKRGSKKGSKK
jgi:hypothetical protein